MNKKKFSTFDLTSKIKESYNELGLSSNTVLEISPDNIDNWEYRDRTDFELGSIENLANSIKLNGQVQPIVVVKKSDLFTSKHHNPKTEYIVIAGYRRWLACKLNNQKVQAIYKELSVAEAIGVLTSENNRESVSDYSKGMFYNKIISDDAITQSELCKRLQIDKNKLSNYMAFSAIDDSLLIEIKDLSLVSARTAGYIRSLCNKGNKYIDLLKMFAKEIANGAGERVIERYIKSKNNQKNKVDKCPSKIYLFGENKLTIKENKMYFSGQSDVIDDFINETIDNFKMKFKKDIHE